MDNQKMISIKLDASLHMLMKRECVTEDVTIAKYIEQSVAEKLGAVKCEDDTWIIKTKS